MAGNTEVKVGDKVRSLLTEGDVRKGETYEVTDTDEDGVYVLDDVAEEDYLFRDQYETLPVVPKVAEATDKPLRGKPAFKVGDRVKVGGDHPYVLSDNNTTGKIIGGSDGRRGEWEVQLDNYGGSLSFKADELEPLAPSLTIRAGAYYRTRDGRKIGPATAEGPHFVVGSYLYHNNGRFYGAIGKYRLDLIAEWTDEPVDVESVSRALFERYEDITQDTQQIVDEAAAITKQAAAPIVTKGRLIQFNKGYGFELAQYGDYVWIDNGKARPDVAHVNELREVRA